MQGDISTNQPQSRLVKFLERRTGPFIGKVKRVGDPQFGGRLWVNIEEYSQTKDPSMSDLVECRYLNPFYGVSSIEANSTTDPYDYDRSQRSYGMWFVPPSIDNDVVVMFVKGETIQAFWIGCVAPENMNQMLPGVGALESTSVKAVGDSQLGKTALYGTDLLPAGEINRKAWDEQSGNQVSKLNSPIHPQAELLRQQGLIQDTIRGTTSSSARRESPSQVFGISTPGPLKQNGKKLPIGPRLTKDGKPSQEKIQVITERGSGHTFVLDDGDSNGDNQLVRLRSASGHQILLNDSAGVVYIANGSGNAWMEFSSNGGIDIYSGGSVSLRSRGDMNFHSDSDINMFARQKVKIKGLQKIVIDGGVIQQYADIDIQSQATTGTIRQKAPNGQILSYAGLGQQHHTSGQHILTGGQIHFNSHPINPNVISTYERTSVLDASGTGTKHEFVPDVNIADKYKSGPLTVTQQGNVTMSGMRMPTHEPFPYHFDKIVTFVGGEPSLNDRIPGTPEFIAARNRLSTNDTVRFGQLQADLQYQLQKQGLGQIQTAVNKTVGSVKGTVGSISSIQKAADDFVKNYSLIYGLPQNTLQPITPLTTGVTEIVNQTIRSVSGDTINLLKDQVFVNQSGILYTAGNIGQSIPGNITNVLGDLTKTTGVFNTAGNIISSAINIPGFGGTAANTLTNLSAVTDSYKNIVGGNITSVTAITSLVSNIGTSIANTVASVGRAIGNIFKW